jgi:pimeloyl-ACP methyl ester carboxylesterase
MILHHKIVGTGEPVFIFHGLFGSLDNWMSFARSLAAYSFQCILVDLRNHGHSRHDDIFNYEVMCDDVLELMQYLKIERTNMLGHSMGGKVVMHLCEKNSDIIKKMVVVDIAPRYYPPHHVQIFDAMHLIDFDFVKTRKDAEQILKNEIEDIATLQFMLKNIYWKTDTQLAWRFNIDALEKNIDAIGAAIKNETIRNTPSLFIRGANSNYINADDVKNIAQKYSNAKVVTIKDAGHWVHADKPKEMLMITLEFLQN